uniref:Uncharacterized protein n=1 Tax=Mustela putorius furo TaxID=9669 RepID=M3YPU3_MUSPF
MRKDHVRTQGKGSHLQAKKRGLRRNQPCQHLDLGLSASRMSLQLFGGSSPRRPRDIPAESSGHMGKMEA